jgi:beta-glucosidase
MPADAEQAIGAIVAAVESGRLPLERLEASRQRRRQALAATASPTGPLEAADPLGPLSNGPLADDRALAQELVAVGLERQGPRRPLEGVRQLIRIDAGLAPTLLPAFGPSSRLAARHGWRSTVIDGQGLSAWSGDAMAPLALEQLDSEPVLLQLFVRGNPFRGGIAQGEPWPQVIQQLHQAERLAGLVVLGSPYLWETLRPLLPPDVGGAYCPAQTPLAQGAALEALLPLSPSDTALAPATAFTD